MWHNQIEIACFAHNTSFNSESSCTPALLFYGRQPMSALERRFNVGKTIEKTPQCSTSQEIQDQMLQYYHLQKDTIVNALQKYRSCFDRKAKASPPTLHSYCLLLDPKITHLPSTLHGFSKPSWIPLYRIEAVYTHSNCLIRKVGTNDTQCMNRVRHRPFKPKYTVQDISYVNPKNFKPDPKLNLYGAEPELFDNLLPQLLKPPQQTVDKNCTWNDVEYITIFNPRDTVQQQKNQQPHTQPAHVVHQPMFPANNVEPALPFLITPAHDIAENANQLPVTIHAPNQPSDNNNRAIPPFPYRTTAATSENSRGAGPYNLRLNPAPPQQLYRSYQF